VPRARLTEVGRKLGVIDDFRWDAFCKKREAVERETARLKSTWVQPGKVPLEDQLRVLGVAMEREYSYFDLLRRPNVSYDSLSTLTNTDNVVDPSVAEQVEIAAKYAGYIERQKGEIERQLAQEGQRLPGGIDYAQVRGLSKEVQQKLNQHKPETIGQAARMQGITPAAISLLLVHLKRRTLAQATEQKIA